jgi:two-component system LytT family sensor kinase
MDEKLLKNLADQLFTQYYSPSDDLDVRNLLDSNLYLRLQNTFMVATGMNGNILDTKGISITPDVIDRSPSFCRYVQSVPQGKQRCIKSDLKVTNLSLKQNEVVVCKCHAGLYDSAVPIHFNHSGRGAFITGQVLLNELTDEYTEEIIRRVSDLGLDRERLLEVIREIPQITEEKLKATTEFMKLLVDYIVKSLEEAEMSRREAEWRSLLRETEMKVIQSKLHPHFLFNILNLISGQALLENAMNTYETIGQLSKLLRYIVKTSRPLVTLEEELENLESYINLQCLRFEDRLTFQLNEIKPLLKKSVIPSMTLQILIENSIKHGIEPKKGFCYVKCSILEQSDKMLIIIEDNGMGIEPDNLKKLNDRQGEFANGFSGLNMVIKRMEYFYSGEFQFSIESEIGAGTKVTILVPIKANS